MHRCNATRCPERSGARPPDARNFPPPRAEARGARPGPGRARRPGAASSGGRPRATTGAVIARRDHGREDGSVQDRGGRGGPLSRESRALIGPLSGRPGPAGRPDRKPRARIEAPSAPPAGPPVRPRRFQARGGRGRGWGPLSGPDRADPAGREPARISPAGSGERRCRGLSGKRTPEMRGRAARTRISANLRRRFVSIAVASHGDGHGHGHGRRRHRRKWTRDTDRARDRAVAITVTRKSRRHHRVPQVTAPSP